MKFGELKRHHRNISDALLNAGTGVDDTRCFVRNKQCITYTMHENGDKLWHPHDQPRKRKKTGKVREKSFAWCWKLGFSRGRKRRSWKLAAFLSRSSGKLQTLAAAVWPWLITFWVTWRIYVASTCTGPRLDYIRYRYILVQQHWVLYCTWRWSKLSNCYVSGLPKATFRNHAVTSFWRCCHLANTIFLSNRKCVMGGGVKNRSKTGKGIGSGSPPKSSRLDLGPRPTPTKKSSEIRFIFLGIFCTQTHRPPLRKYNPLGRVKIGNVQLLFRLWYIWIHGGTVVDLRVMTGP